MPPRFDQTARDFAEGFANNAAGEAAAHRGQDGGPSIMPGQQEARLQEIIDRLDKTQRQIDDLRAALRRLGAAPGAGGAPNTPPSIGGHQTGTRSPTQSPTQSSAQSHAQSPTQSRTQSQWRDALSRFLSEQD